MAIHRLCGHRLQSTRFLVGVGPCGKKLYGTRSNVLAGQSDAEVEALLKRISYPDFMRRHGGLAIDQAHRAVDELRAATG